MTSSSEAGRFTYLGIRDLSQLAEELQKLRGYPPLFSTGKGEYQGYILGFVKGLRISARIIYFIRKCLSTEGCEVSWGHIVDQEGQACSPECDVIIHAPGHLDKWNDSKDPIMEFVFVEARYVKAVVSCKSQLADIDFAYPKQLARFGIDKVFLFAECCSLTNYDNLREKALAAGYCGLWCAYFTEGGADDFTTSDEHYNDFRETLRKLFNE
jgi:hypothetical protein